MTITTMLKSGLLLVTLLACATANAYSPEEKEIVCKKPRFTDFNLPPYTAADNIEVSPESEFIIKISGWANPETIKLMVKGEPAPFKLESNSTFHKITAKLPAQFNGQFVRVNVYAKAVLGCDDQTGWLIKIAK